MIALLISQEFFLVMTSMVGIAVECLLIGMFVGGGKRREIFNKDFMETHFGNEHWQAFGEKAPEGGYPDMGSGRYAAHLSYKDWFDFNNRQRAHYNYVEQIGVIIPLLFVAGIAYPTITGALGWLYFLGRLAFTIGYVAKGPKGRSAGAVILDIALLAVLVLSIMSCVQVYNTKSLDSF